MVLHRPKFDRVLLCQLKRRPAPTIAAAAILTIGLFVPQVWMNWLTYRDFHRFRQQEYNPTKADCLVGRS